MNTTNKLGNIISQLMLECDIDEITLSRQTGVPKSSITRMKVDPNANPTAANLIPIAKFFNISINQLLGDEPLPLNRIKGTHVPEEITATRLPVLEWRWAEDWLINNCKDYSYKLNKWVSTSRRLGDKSFALIINSDEFGPILKKSSLVIIEPNKELEYGDIVLLQMGKDICLRQLLVEGSDMYVKSLNPIVDDVKQIKSNNVIGAVIEVKYNIIFEATSSTSYSSHAAINIDLPLRTI